ncbi:hypothetical protein C9374_004673 [Naegleria lovaniensis]|uniref:F-box domain-containing protein n=1 Tax=Naegleria lovaniensis TaxID=51637 RepID=A0AA88GQB3_NAELO|nr:uncharacterized protein C9374_004673 [Naegleria lovaniensis]KAG2383336.1 hypothetical protein C9374_004673 [Naegleria lovaniensis]
MHHHSLPSINISPKKLSQTLLRTSHQLLVRTATTTASTISASDGTCEESIGLARPQTMVGGQEMEVMIQSSIDDHAEPMSASSLNWPTYFEDTESSYKRKRDYDQFEDEKYGLADPCDLDQCDYSLIITDKDYEIFEHDNDEYMEQQSKKMKLENTLVQYEIAEDNWIFHIFVFLSWEELWALRTVCKNWNDMIKHVPTSLTACMLNPKYFQGFLEKLNPYFLNLTEITLIKYDVSKIRCPRLRNAARTIFLSHPNLRKLELQASCKIGHEEAQALTLISKPHLKEICMPSNGVDDIMCEYLCNGNIPSIEYVDMSMNSISHTGCEFISRWKQLKFLDLSYNLLDGLACKFLSELTELNELKLSGCGIGDKGCEYLSVLYNISPGESQPKLSKLTKLDVSSNEITAIGCQHLKRLDSITWLDISFNPITHEGVVHLGTMKQLTSLQATDASLGATGVAALSESVALRNSLTELNLTKNNICNEGCEYFSNKNFSKLKVLRLGLNRISQLGCKYLSESTFPDLQILDLHYNAIGVKGTCFLSRNTFPSLKELNICSNSIHNPQCPCLKKAPLRNLKKLYINGNNVSDKYLMEIQQTHPDLITDLQLSQQVFNFDPRAYSAKGNKVTNGVNNPTH